MSTKQFITDAATRHQIFLQRYGAGQSKEARKVLNQLRRDILGRLGQEADLLQTERLQAVLADVEALIVEAFGTISNRTIFSSQQLAKLEADFSVKLFDKATTFSAGFTLPPDEVLVAAILNSQMKANLNSALTVEEALATFSKKKAAQIAKVISDGVLLGETTSAIALSVSDLTSKLIARQLDTLVRTITNHSAAVARDQVYAANEDILDGYQWVSTLDRETTFICGSRDGNIYNNFASDPRPPAHWGCRSTTIPVVKPEYDLGAKVKGARPSKGSTGIKKVSGKTTYSGWLKSQPKPFIDEALGIERSKLFRSGKLTIDQFVDPTGRVYTLKQLADMNPFVFM